MHGAQSACEWQLAVTRHAEGEADGRCLDGQAADVDRGKNYKQVEVGQPTREVRRDDGHKRKGILAGARICDELAHVSRDGDHRREQEDGADDGGPDDRGDDRSRCLPPRVLGFLGQSACCVEPVDHEQGHEHRRQERARLVAEA